MKGEGRSHGSITVINAMPCGIGATMGVDLNTTATFEETDGRRSVTILNDGSEDKNMARSCVSRAYEYAEMDESDGWNLVTDSEIPVSRGLKSSSCACNAILRAVFSVIGVDIDPVDLIRLGVDCAREARVTVTGSFDDACGCGLGGLVMTDNRRDEILARSDIGDYDVVIHVPEFKIKKRSPWPQSSPCVGCAHCFLLRQAADGRSWSAYSAESRAGCKCVWRRWPFVLFPVMPISRRQPWPFFCPVL